MSSSAFDPTVALDPRLAGRLAFLPRLPGKPPLPPGRHALGLFETRDAMLRVPEHIDPRLPTPLVVLFHGGGGSAEKPVGLVHFGLALREGGRRHLERRYGDRSRGEIRRAAVADALGLLEGALAN